MNRILMISLAAASFGWVAPSAAQERVLQVFGEDKCPANTICVRAPESERFRIPKDLRKPTISPAQQSWATRQQVMMDEGRAGPSGCNTAGNQGWAGCFGEEMRKAREEARLREEEGTVPRDD
jgi:hypothetical protein